MKYDGYRGLIRKDGDDVCFFTREGHDWSDRVVAIADQVRMLPARRAWLDGELVVLLDDGTPSFGALQRAAQARDQSRLVLCAFDLLYLDRDLCPEPLRARKELLSRLLDGGSWNLRYVDHVVGDGPALFELACQHHLEGIVSKRSDSPYRPGIRAKTWVKTKWQDYPKYREVAWKWWEKSGR